MVLSYKYMQESVCSYTMYSFSRESDGGPEKGPLMLDVLISLYVSPSKTTSYKYTLTISTIFSSTSGHCDYI